MSAEISYELDHEKVKNAVLLCLASGVTPIITGSPGLGKSAIVHEIAQERRLVLLDERLSMADPTDMKGLPIVVDGIPRFVPFSANFPLDDSTLPNDPQNPGEKMKGWLLFLDELTSAPKSVQAAAYKLVLDRMVGDRKLHPNVFIVGAGNKMTDRAVVNPMSTAFASRLCHLELGINPEKWVQTVAPKIGLDFRITAFLGAFNDCLYNFNPENTNTRTFASPRTWEFVNKLLKGSGGKITSAFRDALMGTIDLGTAGKFIAFVDSLGEIPKLEDIVQRPQSIAVPQQRQYRWATVLSIHGHYPKHKEALATFVERFEFPMQIVFWRMVVREFPDMVKDSVFQDRIRELTKQMV